jgi:hypothetical protein
MVIAPEVRESRSPRSRLGEGAVSLEVFEGVQVGATDASALGKRSAHAVAGEAEALQAGEVYGN